VEPGLERRIGHGEGIGSPQERPLRPVGEAGHEPGEAPKADDLGHEVPARPGPPGGPSVLAGRQRPERLTPVEEGGGPSADPLAHELGPVDPRELEGEFGHRRQRRGRRARAPRGGEQAVERARPAGLGAGGKRRLEILRPDLAGLDPLEVPAARHRHPHARDPTEPRCDPGERLVHLAEERIDSDRGVERPGGRQGADRGLGGAQDGTQPGRDDLGHGHDRSPRDGGSVRRPAPCAGHRSAGRRGRRGRGRWRDGPAARWRRDGGPSGAESSGPTPPPRRRG